MRKAWSKMQKLYLESKGHQYPLNREGLEHTSTLREDIYRQHKPGGEPIPILVLLVSITDTPRKERRLHLQCGNYGWDGREDHNEYRTSEDMDKGGKQ